MLFLHPTNAEIAPALGLAHLNNFIICSVKRSHNKIWVNTPFDQIFQPWKIHSKFFPKCWMNPKNRQLLYMQPTNIPKRVFDQCWLSFVHPMNVKITPMDHLESDCVGTIPIRFKQRSHLGPDHPMDKWGLPLLCRSFLSGIAVKMLCKQRSKVKNW